MPLEAYHFVKISYHFVKLTKKATIHIKMLHVVGAS